MGGRDQAVTVTALVDDSFRAAAAVRKGDGERAKRIIAAMAPVELRTLLIEAGILYALACDEYERRAGTGRPNPGGAQHVDVD